MKQTLPLNGNQGLRPLALITAAAPPPGCRTLVCTVKTVMSSSLIQKCPPERGGEGGCVTAGPAGGTAQAPPTRRRKAQLRCAGVTPVQGSHRRDACAAPERERSSRADTTRWEAGPMGERAGRRATASRGNSGERDAPPRRRCGRNLFAQQLRPVVTSRVGRRTPFHATALRTRCRWPTRVMALWRGRAARPSQSAVWGQILETLAITLE